MKLTVGPHSPAVYWRRRALVLAVVAVLVTAIVATCSRSATPTADPARSRGTTSSATPSATTTPAPTETATPRPDPSLGVTTAAPSGHGKGEAATADAPRCSDSDLTLTAVVSPDPGIYGGTLTFTVKIRNVAGSACRRDVGSGAQELRVQRDGVVVWSSDDCDTPHESDVRTFGPNIETEFRQQWSSYRVRPDDCRAATTPAPAGAYQVVVRLDTKLSAPIPFTIAK